MKLPCLCVSGVIFSLLFAATSSAAPAAAPTVHFSGDPIAQLQSGKEKGTFHLVFPAQIEFSGGGHCEMVTTIVDAFFHDPLTTKIPDAKNVTFEGDLHPGSYDLAISPADEKNADYWPAERQQIHIDKEGRLYQMRDGWSKPGPFVLDRRMKGLSPDDGQVAADPAAVLKWPAVPGATHYRGDYFIEGQNWFDVETNQFTIGAGVAAGSGCMWRINAIDARGKILARGEGHFWGNGTTKAQIDEASQGGSCNAGAILHARAYLGIQPLPEQVPKDPATPIQRDENGSYTVQDEASGFIPGIFVAQVYPGSPAVDAGLIPDDVIIAVDGQRVPSEGNEGDIEAFIEQVSAMEVDRKMTLIVRRFPRELTLHATIGRMGGATTQPVPATLPAAPLPASPESGWTWSDVDAGSPIVTPFKAKAGADVDITQKDGLADDFITCMAELPNGAMAFGSREGLSIWDGSEIRTYRGPSFSLTGGTEPGNSGLPVNEIQCLTCDSRGRLWVGTRGGICRIDSLKAAKWRVLTNPEKAIFARRGMDSALDVQKIFEASDGTIVLGGHEAAIILIDPKTDRPTLIHRDDDMNHWITAIAEDGKHRLWICIEGVGVMRYEGGKLEKVNEPWNTANVDRLAIDKKGTVWIAGNEGFSALHADGTSEKFTHDILPGEYIETLKIDRADRLWIIGYEGVAIRVTDEANAGKSSWKYFASTSQHTLSDVLGTSDGSWWIASLGVHRMTRLDLSDVPPSIQAINRVKQTVEKQYPNIDLDRRTAVAAGGIVIASAGHKLLRYDGKKWEDLSTLRADHDVYDLFADRKNGTIWVATAGAGLIGLDPSGKIRRYNSDPTLGLSVIYSLDQAPDGTLYAGTQNGVYRLVGDKWEHLESDLFQVGQVLADRNGRVWMHEVTWDKLYVYDGKVFREIKEQTPLANDQPVRGSLRLDAAGDVLIDIAPRPLSKSPQRTFKWKASEQGPIGPPVEVQR